MAMLLAAGCRPDDGTAGDGVDASNAMRDGIASARPLAAAAVAGSRDAGPTIQFAGPADAAAIAAVRRATAAMNDATVTAAQSFRIMAASRQVATFVSGEGTSPHTTYAGCFAAIVQDNRAMVVPTIGSGNWEAETCGGISAVGILSAADPVLIGIVYDAFSPNATVVEPVVLRWHRRGGTFAIDEMQSMRASRAGITSIVALRKLVTHP